MNDQQTIGHEAAAKVADALRPKQTPEEKAAEEMAIAKNQLEMIRNNPELSSMYNDNAKVGSENLGGDLPMLKVHATGRSTVNELANGGEPDDGAFFYAPKQMQFPEVTAHILTISRGYYAEGMNVDAKTGKKKAVWTQIVGGVIANDDLMYPFLSYVTGTKLQPMWDFGKAAGKFTRAKPFGIPMFALSVRMYNKKEKNAYSTAWVTYYEIRKNESGEPILVTDPSLFNFLRDTVEVLKEQTERLINSKEIDGPHKVQAIESTTVTDDPPDEPQPGSSTQPVNPDDIPF